MSMFMFWMMGSSLNLFTIMFIMNFTLTPIKAIMNVNQSTIKLKLSLQII